MSAGTESSHGAREGNRLDLLGNPYVLEAAASAKTTARFGFDRILLADQSSVELLGVLANEFTSIQIIDIQVGNTREKSRLLELIPAGYETYLYLDCDTLVFDDLSLGFDKAGQHGIALVPAPNYNMCTVRHPSNACSGAMIMQRLGMRSLDQMVYNSGVIFFDLQVPSARRVFERWRQLCDLVDLSIAWPDDQILLSIAMKQLAFAPYTLTPLYNYRAKGELAIGKVRIWHSHRPPPPNLNDLEAAWPARRFSKPNKLIDQRGG